MNHDLIGDVHGQAGKLDALLHHLGYRQRQGAWRHADRTAIFVGDFIDRGDKGLEVVRTVRSMVDAGSAMAVMGNHELNAMAWHTPDPRAPGEYLRTRHSAPWGAKNRHQHQAFLAQVEHQPEVHREVIEWFFTLPLWLDLPELRVVHACWHGPWMAWLSPLLREGRFLTPELLIDATTEPADPADKDGPEPSVFKAVEVLTNGIEIALPAEHAFTDKDGIRRDRVRARWWDPEATSYRQIAKMSNAQRMALPDLDVPAHARPAVPVDKPIFFGHYWMNGTPELQSPSAACVDYSAGAGGPLVAYRWDGGPLSADRFAWVP